MGTEANEKYSTKKNIYIAGNRKKDEAKMAHTEKKET